MAVVAIVGPALVLLGSTAISLDSTAIWPNSIGTGSTTLAMAATRLSSDRDVRRSGALYAMVSSGVPFSTTDALRPTSRCSRTSDRRLCASSPRLTITASSAKLTDKGLGEVVVVASAESERMGTLPD